MKRMIAIFLSVTVMLSALTACAQGSEPQITESTVHTQPPQMTIAQEESEATEGQAEPLVPVEQEEYPAVDPVITEVMPDNRNLVLSHELDWIELYNPGDMAISLDGFYLTDDPALPEAMPLEGMQIPGGGYLTIVLDSHGPFQLSELGETVYLVRKGQVVSQLSFGKAANAESFDGGGACDFPTPGFANSLEGYRSYLEGLTLPELIINEVMPSNSSYYGVGGVYYDLVEVKNRSDQAINLSEYYLTDRWENTQRFYFPNVTLEPGEYYVVLCSGNTGLGDNHAPFKLGTAGETLYLARRGTFIDALAIPADLKSDESYGRSGNLPVYLFDPTPGTQNTEGYLTGIAAPAASLASGLYDETVHVELTGEGTIYYTLDGARPTTGSQVYTGPITVDDVTTIRAMCVSNGRESAICNFTYVVGKEHDLPVLVISLPLYSRNSLLANVNSSIEYESVMTLIEDGEMKFSVPFGMRLHGNDSRLGDKKNFQLRFRGEYGAGKLEYRLFEDRDIDEFDSLLLKGGSEDWANAMMRDELSTALANGTSALYTQAMKPVVLYLGGEYWGVHFLRERFSDAYVASHLGVSEESVDILFSSDGYTQVGSNADFTALKNYILNNDMSTPENYAYLAQRIDVNSLIDWYTFRSYLDDSDFANIRRFRSSESDGKWRWMFFDLDWGFYYRGSQPVSGILQDYNGDRIMINGLLASQAGQDAFLKRYAYMMRTVLNEEYINRQIDELVSAIQSEMPRDRERWGESVSDWEYNVQLLRDFLEDDARTTVILKDIQTYFALTDAQMESYFGELYQN